MSEAMSNLEIEDVLSSIRRLVSEDLRPAPRPVAEVVEDKLILTPALRVVVSEPAQAEAPTPTRSLPRLHLGLMPVTEEVVASLEQAVEAQGLDWESETGDPMPETVAFEWSSGGWAAQGEPVEAEIVEAANADSMLDLAALSLVEIIADAPMVEVTDLPSWAQEDPGEGDESLMPGMAMPEPDPMWADEAEAEVVAGLDAGADQSDDSLLGETESQPAGSAPEMTFDEGVLRDLVRDLIREELQGGLGERITRNVRKLVRAEIARALATRDFE